MLEIIRDATARIVRAEEALEDGEHDLAWRILRDLEQDVAGWLGGVSAPAAVIRLEIEAKPTVRLEASSEGEQVGLVDWLGANDDLAALVARALEAIETREAP
jgi:hypothetical protein